MDILKSKNSEKSTINNLKFRGGKMSPDKLKFSGGKMKKLPSVKFYKFLKRPILKTVGGKTFNVRYVRTSKRKWLRRVQKYKNKRRS